MEIVLNWTNYMIYFKSKYGRIIIVPIYNVEKYLRKCIESILNQTLENIEVILINDGSTDNCGKIIDEYEKQDKRVISIHKENGGQSSARNMGLDIAKGKYIGFIDSDDYIDEYMYESLYNAIENSKADICVCGRESYSEFSQLNYKTELEDELIALTGWTKKKVQMKNNTYYRK